MLHKLTASATAGVEKIRIPISELKLGMFVKELDCAWIDSPFLVHGFVVREQKQLEQLRALCKHVYVDITRDSCSAGQARTQKPAVVEEYKTTASFIDNLAPAQKTHRKAKAVVANMFEDFRNGKLFEPESMRATVTDCVDNIIHNPDSMLWLTMIKNKDEYTAEHSLNVALLSITLGRAEGLSVESLRELGLCAMLHDVGKVKIPDEILNKEGRLDTKQFDIMKMHTVHGKKLLLNQKGIPDAAADIALSHHEKVDGSGYPRGLTSEEIPYLVKIVAIADAYDAMTSGRVYSVAKPAAEALKLLLKSKNQHHDARLLNRFIDCIGVYPIGSIAELNSGEVGIVLPSESEDNLQPVVLVVRDSNKQPCENTYLDLRTAKRKDNARPYMIRALHPDGSFGISLGNYNDPRFLAPPSSD